MIETAATDTTEPEPSHQQDVSIKLVLPDVCVPRDPPDVQIAFRDEGFSRSSIVMEERSCRSALQKRWQVSLIEGDDELRVRQWNRECYEKELLERENHREAAAAARRRREFEEMSNRYRSAAAEQTNRIFLKRFLREKRVAMQADETVERRTIEVEWAKWFEISIQLGNFGVLMKVILPNEEIQGRAKIAAAEMMVPKNFFVPWMWYLQRAGALERNYETQLRDVFAADEALILREIEVIRNQRAFEERELKRRDILRKAEEAEEREREKLAAIYGATPLTTRPGSGARGNRIVLRPSDHLEIAKALHPPNNIRDFVRHASRMNQENNSLFMALDQRLVKKEMIPNTSTEESRPSLQCATSIADGDKQINKSHSIPPPAASLRAAPHSNHNATDAEVRGFTADAADHVNGPEDGVGQVGGSRSHSVTFQI